LSGEQIGVGAAQSEMWLEQLHLAQRVHLAGAGRLVEKISQIKEVEQAGEGTFRTRRALGHQGEPSSLPAETTHDETGIAERHPPNNEALHGTGFAHNGFLTFLTTTKRA